MVCFVTTIMRFKCRAFASCLYYNIEPLRRDSINSAGIYLLQTSCIPSTGAMDHEDLSGTMKSRSTALQRLFFVGLECKSKRAVMRRTYKELCDEEMNSRVLYFCIVI